MCEPWWKVILDVVATLTGLLIACVAIWGDQIRMFFAGPRLDIEVQPRSRGPAVRLNNNKYGHYVLLKVVNLGRGVAINCRVQVVRIEKSQHKSGLGFADLYLSYPLQLQWTPSESKPELITITDWWPVDLGRVVREEPNNGFHLLTYTKPNDFDVSVPAGGRCRFHIRVSADNARHSPDVIIEVAWDGQWADDATEMLSHLDVNKVRNQLKA